MEEKNSRKLKQTKNVKMKKNKNVKMQFGLCYSTCITDTK